MPEFRIPDRPALSLFARVESALANADLPCAVRESLAAVLQQRLATVRHGDADSLAMALQSLPRAMPSSFDFSGRVARIGCAEDLDPGAGTTLEATLQSLHPWRKGPFELFGVPIDAEWRSDLKWDRVVAASTGFAGRTVLDVGCGNGYYLLRMLGAGARFALGIDPSVRALAQFEAFRTFCGDAPACLLPLGSEDLPRPLACFDTVLSMGVLYHRRDPHAHLRELFDALRPGGELLLETLVIPGAGPDVLEPRPRYAQMRNVWALPTCTTLLNWVAEAGFVEAALSDCTPTTIHEQRRTPWMRFESLADFLDPADPTRTIEGYPAPLRAILRANRGDD